MTRLRDNSNQNNNLSKSDWVAIKELSPFKVVENKWMLWASWGLTLFLPFTLAVITVFKLFN